MAIRKLKFDNSVKYKPEIESSFNNFSTSGRSLNEQ